VSTLVLCVDRSNDIGAKTGVAMPVAGWEAVRSLVTDVGLADPEDASVNSLLEALRVARELQDSGDEATVAVVSGGTDSRVGADRAIAAQIDELIERYDPESAVVVVDSAEDERAVPIIESRIGVDSVDRVVVRQARDIESTYYLIKQFLGDEELRSTVMVPLGVALIVLPALAIQFSTQVAMAGLASLLGAVLLFKGLSLDERVEDTPEQVREALYSGQVSVVTYAVAGGLALVGVFLGALSATNVAAGQPALIQLVLFTYGSVPWLALAALTASAGRLVDEYIRDDEIPSPVLNLPFGVLAVGLVVRGFTGFFLEQQAVLDHLTVQLWSIVVEIQAGQRLVGFIVAGIVVSLVGVRVAALVTEEAPEEAVEKQ
jgi:putative membrane protein